MVLGEVKTADALHAIPLVILTASADEANELQTRERSAIAYLAQPIGVEDLHRRHPENARQVQQQQVPACPLNSPVSVRDPTFAQP